MRWCVWVSLFWVIVAYGDPSQAGSPPEAYVKGLQLAKEGKHMEALRIFRQVAKDHPDLPGLHYNMGNALFRLGEPSDAVRAYQEAIRIDPKDADAYYNLAMVYSVMDEMELAMSALEEVVRIRPEDGEAFYRLAMGHYSRRNVERAWSYLMLAKKAGYPVPSQLEEALKGQGVPPAQRGEGKP